MNLFIYSDESGVFDKYHNEYFVFGGIILLSKDERDVCTRKYIAAERVIRDKNDYDDGIELKACVVGNAEKGKLYRSLNQYFKFGVVVKQEDVLDSICSAKKSKQRYLDYVYKIGIKNALIDLMDQDLFAANDITGLYFFVDEHTTATDGCYELREGLEQEFKYGTHNLNYSMFYPPIFTQLQTVDVSYCNSRKKTLVRAADIIANHIYHQYVIGNKITDNRLHITELPHPF